MVSFFFHAARARCRALNFPGPRVPRLGTDGTQRLHCTAAAPKNDLSAIASWARSRQTVSEDGQPSSAARFEQAACNSIGLLEDRLGDVALPAVAAAFDDDALAFEGV